MSVFHLEDKNPEYHIGSAFVDLIESGTYSKLKQTELFLKQAKDTLRTELEQHEGRRHEFKNLNWVAKFVPKNVWETHHAGIIEDLLCYVHPEIALSVIKLDAKSLKEDGRTEFMKPFLLPSTSYVRPTLNKKGKELLKVNDYLFGGQSEEELVAEIRAVTSEKKRYEEQYEDFKRAAMRSLELREKKKVSTPYGSVSLLKNRPEWDLERVCDALGEDFLVTYGKVDMVKIDDFIVRGMIPKSVVSAHRILKDIRLDFIVMDIASEEKAMNFHRSMQIQKSLKRFA